MLFAIFIITYLVICIFTWYHRVSAAAHVPVSGSPSLPYESDFTLAPQSSFLSDPILHPVLPIPTPSAGEPLDDTRGEEVVPSRATSTPIKSSARLSTGVELFSSSIPEIHEQVDEFVRGAGAPCKVGSSFDGPSRGEESHVEAELAVESTIEITEPVERMSKET